MNEQQNAAHIRVPTRAAPGFVPVSLTIFWILLYTYLQPVVRTMIHPMLPSSYVVNSQACGHERMRLQSLSNDWMVHLWHRMWRLV